MEEGVGRPPSPLEDDRYPNPIVFQPMGYQCMLEQEPLVLSVVLKHHHECRPYCGFDQLQLGGEGAYGPQVDTSSLQFLDQTIGSQPLLPKSPGSRLGIEFCCVDARVQRVIGVGGQEPTRFPIQQQKGDQVVQTCDRCIFGSYPEDNVLEKFER